MDYFSTSALVGVVRNLILPQSFLLDRYFTQLAEFETEEIEIQVDKGKRRIAPLVHPTVEGKVVANRGYISNRFKPAYVKDKRVFQPGQALKRVLGESLGGQLSPEERRRRAIIASLQDQTEMLTRRLELMAAETLRRGKLLITGEGFEPVDLDFRRNPALTIALAGAKKWNQSTATPLDDIDAWSILQLQASGATLIDVVMDFDAWTVFRSNPQVQDELKRLAFASQTPLELGKEIKPGAQFMGTIRNRNVWVYVDWYVDPTSGNEVPMLPSGTVLFGSQQIEGLRAFGAILDDEVLMPMAIYPKSWVTQDPSNRMLMLQSAPVTVPSRVDASGCATVL